MPDLKPCPFCGGKARLIKKSWTEFGGPYDFTVHCDDCSAGIRCYFPTENEAIEAWNRRAGEEDKHEAD